MSECEISKDKAWIGQYHCNTHDVWFRDDGDSVECCPAGKIEDEYEKKTEGLEAKLREAVKRGNWLQGELTATKGEVVSLNYVHTWEQERTAQRKREGETS